MGLFGALYAGVSGLDSQSNAIGIISNNIANVNTVGYKQGQSEFDTLVVPSGTTSFSPGGVIGGNQQLVNQQGTISATQSSTDIAISGNGLLVVNTEANGTGQTLYTRAGDFSQDDNGNFVNSEGYYLQGLPINADGVTAQANPQNLKTVSISESATGAATATSQLTVAANLDASQATLLGAGVTATMQAINGTSSANVGATADQILVGNDVPGTNSNNMVRGDTFNIVSNGKTTDTFTYGGFTIGRSVTTDVGTADAALPLDTAGGVGGLGDGGNILDTETAIPITVTNAGTITIPTASLANPGDYAQGDNVSLSGITTTDGSSLTLAQLNSEWRISSDTGGTITLTNVSVTAPTTASTGTISATVSNRTYPFTGNILNATSATGDFMGTGSTALSTSDFTAQALGFSISVNGGTPSTFSYSATPDPSEGTFNNLTTLAQAISDAPGLTATVTGGRLYVSAENPNLQLTFVNGDATGNGTQAGINWIQELDIKAPTVSISTNYFNSLQSLANEINTVDPTNLTASITNPTGATTLAINEANPEQTINFTDGTDSGLADSTEPGSILKELGIANLVADPTVSTAAYTTGTLPITYSAASATQDMSSGSVTPQFSKDVTIYDAQGNSHTIAMNFVKIGTNNWAMELTAVPASDVDSTIKNASGVGDGQIASGILTFNGEGDLTSVTGTISNSNIPINWTNGAAPSQLTLNLGIGTDTGLIQSAAAFNVSTAQQNGSPVGELTGVSINANGYVIASFSNGQTQNLYQVPLASVNNPDGLEAVSGNAYIQTDASGIANLELPGTSGVGTFTPSALEDSNVDLSTQLTDLIVAQQAYGANSKVLTVADSLLQELDQIIQ